MAILAAFVSACGQQLPDPVPLAEPAELANQLQVVPEQPQLITFKWRYRGRDGRFSGDGGVRVNPPDSVRLDLLGPGWSGVQSAVLLEGRVIYMGEQRITLPPHTFLWTALGVFRPPADVRPQGASRGERTELTYRLSELQEITFAFDGQGRLIEAALKLDDDVIEEIKLTFPDESGATGSWAAPMEARYRDLVGFHEINIEVEEVKPHEPFEARIFGAANR